ncbi:MAG TPA: TAXI family TRAP transporter solute-binding subunit [Candidatus Bathyarchaeia archaeon]|nr:TAXI family TRAP transporter solute-binding subunit [Candidatus Bathyarchaeia archaeon]
MKGRAALWTVALLLTAAVIGLSLRYTDPFPPRRIALATGQPDGAYAAFGREYQARLAHEGLRVDLVGTNGSLDNLQKLLRREVDVAFVQGGTYQLVQDPGHVLRGIAALYREPLWIFYRGHPATDGLTSFAERRIAVGAPGSGTEAVARAMLSELGIATTGPSRLSLSSADARRALEDGRIDAAFIITSYLDPNVSALLRRPDVRLLSFRRDVAFARNFRYLSPMPVTEGLLDLKEDLPREEVTLMAPAALLMCRETLHPRVVEQLLTTARAIHGPGSLLDPPGHFPTREGVDLPLHDAADSFLSRGESFLSRVLPYWALRWVIQLRLLLLPLVAVWVPLFKIMPWLLRWRGNRLLEHQYALLRDAEAAVAGASRPDALRAGIDRLEQLRAQVEALARRLSLPHQRDVYHARLHVALVLTEARDRLARLEGGRRTEAT